eukprot:gene12416-biopygen7577
MLSHETKQVSYTEAYKFADEREDSESRREDGGGDGDEEDPVLKQAELDAEAQMQRIKEELPVGGGG